MGIVSVQRFNEALASPQWTVDQEEEAGRLLDEVEDELVGQLNAPITLLSARTEQAPVLDSGLLLTRYPVGAATSVTSLDGTTVTGGVLPSGWQLEPWGMLRRDPGDTVFSPTAWPPLPSGTLTHHGYTAGTISITYQPGWGDRPALRQAIIRITKGRFLNQHDDTVTARALETAPPPPLPETWTPEELDKLNIYCWLTVWR